MAKPTKTATEPSTTEKPKADIPLDKDGKPVISPQSQLESILKKAPGDHYNFEEEVYYKVSTGSLSMDIEMEGGIGPGLISLQGAFETGKTSFTLACMKAFLETVPNSRGFLVRAESRLSHEIQQRAGIPFVFDAAQWVDGTCFVLETNIYEFALNSMRALVTANPLQKRYFFFIDSMDGMTLKDDMLKDVGGGVRVAGAPLLTKQFLQKMANAMAKRGHICAISGQISANIHLDNTPATRTYGMPGGGGNAKDHFANHILIFQSRLKDDYILQDPEANPDRLKNKFLGHWARCLLKKTPNEKSNVTVKYPIRYGRTAGHSVWVEYELVDAMLSFGLLKKKGTWLKMEDVLLKELEEGDMKEVPVQLQGVDQWRVFLESRADITQYLFAKFKSMISTTTSPTTPKAAA